MRSFHLMYLITPCHMLKDEHIVCHANHHPKRDGTHHHNLARLITLRARKIIWLKPLNDKYRAWFSTVVSKEVQEDNKLLGRILCSSAKIYKSHLLRYLRRCHHTTHPRSHCKNSAKCVIHSWLSGVASVGWDGVLMSQSSNWFCNVFKIVSVFHLSAKRNILWWRGIRDIPKFSTTQG